MSVKTIFKALIGTVFIIIVSSVVIEFYNVSVMSMQLKQVSKMAAKQACVLFTQETYKEMKNGTSTIGGAVKMSDIRTTSGTKYISGDFYGTGTPQDIWKKIYGKDTFKNFCNSKPEGRDQKMDEIFKDLGTMLKAYKLANGESVAGDDKAKAIMFKNNMYTTSNIGVPYLDDDIVNKMYEWNLAKLLMGQYNSSIQQDADGERCINYRGFRCYANQAKLNFKYQVYDLGDTNSGSKTGRVAFHKLTGLNIKNKGAAGAGITVNATPNNPNYYVTVVEIDYTVPVSYQGITPLKNIFDYLWKTEVQGLSDTAPTEKGDKPNVFGAKPTLTSKGGELSSTGKLIYTLVR